MRRRSFFSFAGKAMASAWILRAATGSDASAQEETSDVDALYNPSLSATSLRGEAADRLCIRRLVDGWAHYADRRMPVKQAALFVPDGVVNNYEGDPASHQPVSTLRGRDELIKALAVLNTFPMTFHFNGQSEIAIKGNRAVGETYCVAHQVLRGSGSLQILAIRYNDRFVRKDGRWFFEERNLIINISNTVPHSD